MLAIVLTVGEEQLLEIQFADADDPHILPIGAIEIATFCPCKSPLMVSVVVALLTVPLIGNPELMVYV